MNADTLVGAAADIAYLVRTQPPSDVQTFISRDIAPEDKDSLIVVLAALVDIDETKAALTRRLHESPTIVEALTNLQKARLASYRYEHQAYKHGDRDPQVVQHAAQYQRGGVKCPG